MKDHLPPEFTGPICDAMVAALDWSYREAVDLKDEALGLDEQWYGLTVYKLIGPQLGVRLAEFGGAFVEPVGVTYEVFLGRHHVRYNKLRGSMGARLHAYPRPSRAAQRMADLNQAQLELPMTGTDQPVSMKLLGGLDAATPTEWILGHMGTSLDGLTSVYLCAPALAVEGEITAWQVWVPIYHRGAVMPAYDSVPAPGLPEPVEIDEPMLRVKPARRGIRGSRE